MTALGMAAADAAGHAGFDATPLSYSFRLVGPSEIPQNNPMNPKFRSAIRTWRKLPPAKVDFVGPRVIHGLG